MAEDLGFPRGKRMKAADQLVTSFAEHARKREVLAQYLAYWGWRHTNGANVRPIDLPAMFESHRNGDGYRDDLLRLRFSLAHVDLSRFHGPLDRELVCSYPESGHVILFKVPGVWAGGRRGFCFDHNLKVYPVDAPMEG